MQVKYLFQQYNLADENIFFEDVNKKDTFVKITFDENRIRCKKGFL